MPPIRTKLNPTIVPLETDIYITRKSNYKALLKRALYLADDNKPFIIYGLGSIIPRAIKLSLEVQDKRPNFTHSVKTHSVELLDYVEEKDELGFVETRWNSAIKIEFVQLLKSTI